MSQKGSKGSNVLPTDCCVDNNNRASKVVTKKFMHLHSIPSATQEKEPHRSNFVAAPSLRENLSPFPSSPAATATASSPETLANASRSADNRSGKPSLLATKVSNISWRSGAPCGHSDGSRSRSIFSQGSLDACCDGVKLMGESCGRADRARPAMSLTRSTGKDTLAPRHLLLRIILLCVHMAGTDRGGARIHCVNAIVKLVKIEGSTITQNLFFPG